MYNTNTNTNNTDHTDNTDNTKYDNNNYYY